MLDDPGQRRPAAELLGRHEYLDLPESILLPSLTGEFRCAPAGLTRRISDFHVFSRHQAGFPWRSQAAWMVRSSSVLLGKPIGDEQCEALVQQCYRPDLYREAARYLDLASPSHEEKPEGLHAGDWIFEPGVELGPDLLIGGSRFLRQAC